MRRLWTHSEVGVGQSCTEVPAEAAPALTAQHIRRRSAAEGLQSLPTHLHAHISISSPEQLRPSHSYLQQRFQSFEVCDTFKQSKTDCSSLGWSQVQFYTRLCSVMTKTTTAVNTIIMSTWAFLPLWVCWSQVFLPKLAAALVWWTRNSGEENGDETNIIMTVHKSNFRAPLSDGTTPDVSCHWVDLRPKISEFRYNVETLKQAPTLI